MKRNNKFLLDLDIKQRIFGDFFRKEEKILEFCTNNEIIKQLKKLYHLKNNLIKKINGFELSLFYDNFNYYTNIKNDILKCGYAIQEDDNGEYLKITAKKKRVNLKNFLNNIDYVYVTTKSNGIIDSNLNCASLNKGDIIYVDKTFKCEKGKYDVITVSLEKLKNVSFIRDRKNAIGICINGEINTDAIINREYLIELI